MLPLINEHIKSTKYKYLCTPFHKKKQLCSCGFRQIIFVSNAENLQHFILNQKIQQCCERRQIHSSLSSFALPSSPSQNEDDSSTSCPEYELSYWRILTYLDSSPSDWRPSLYIGVGSPTPLPQFQYCYRTYTIYLVNIL